MVIKKICLLISLLLLSQSVQAGKYFDYDEETQTCLFKKCGKKFNKALGNLCIFKKPIKKIEFHENVRLEQRALVLKAKEFSILPLVVELFKNPDDLKKYLPLFSEKGLMNEVKSLSLEEESTPENIYNSIQRGFCKTPNEAKARMEKGRIVKDGLAIRDPEVFLECIKHATDLQWLQISGHLVLRGLVKDEQEEAFRKIFYQFLDKQESLNEIKSNKLQDLKIEGLTWPPQDNWWKIQRNAKPKRDIFWNSLAEALKGRKITELTLHDLRDAFYPENLKSLALVLTSMDSLQKIDLSQNFYNGKEGDEGITNLADIIVSLKHIKEIELNHTGMTQIGAQYLLQKLTNCSSLKKVGMSCNCIEGDISEAFCSVMGTCPNLTNISLSGNNALVWPKNLQKWETLKKNGWMWVDGGSNLKRKSN